MPELLAVDEYRVTSRDFDLTAVNPEDTRGCDERFCDRALHVNAQRIADLQDILSAEAKHAVLIVLQSMDTGGKDPIIRDVLSAANAQYCRVTAFKKATEAEQTHDRFWRFHPAVPAKGEIGVFNRSYYDEVIADIAHSDRKPEDCASDWRQINDFEYMLSENSVRVVKLFLHISSEEQKHRLQERMDDPTRHWELSENDFKERKFWDGYMRAYEAAVRASMTDYAPWYVIPSDRKWYRDYVASEIIRETLESVGAEYPPPDFDLNQVTLE